jgi:hypothetical protein
MRWLKEQTIRNPQIESLPKATIPIKAITVAECIWRIEKKTV